MIHSMRILQHISVEVFFQQSYVAHPKKGVGNKAKDSGMVGLKRLKDLFSNERENKGLLLAEGGLGAKIKSTLKSRLPNRIVEEEISHYLKNLNIFRQALIINFLINLSNCRFDTWSSTKVPELEF